MNRKMIMIAGAALVGIIAVWYLVLWSPQGASLTQARAGETAAVQKEASLKSQVAALQRQRALLPALQAKLATVNEAIPTTPDIDKVIDDVNAVVLSSGVSITSLTPPQAGATTGALTLTIAVGGTYFQLVDFINKLNAMPRLAVVDGFGLGTPDKATGVIGTSITARVFVGAAAPATTKTTATTIAGAH